MAVMAKPSKQAFIVSSKDKDRFQKERMPKSNWDQIREMASNFDKINLKKDWEKLHGR